MAIQNAMNFINDASRDKNLRTGLYTLKQEDILPELEKLGYAFSLDEFEESINMLHVQCQSEEQANKLFEVVNWFKLLCC